MHFICARGSRHCYISLFENEELGLDFPSLRRWKFNREITHILKPTIIGIFVVYFYYISHFAVMVGNRVMPLDDFFVNNPTQTTKSS